MFFQDGFCCWVSVRVLGEWVLAQGGCWCWVFVLRTWVLVQDKRVLMLGGAAWVGIASCKSCGLQRTALGWAWS